MKFKNSLAFRLIVYIFLIMSAANFLAGAWYLFLSRRTGIVPDRWFELFRSPVQLLILSLILGTLLSTLLSRMLVRPINRLVEATKKVAQGDFSVRVHLDEGEDEIAELVGSFNDMTQELGNNEIFKKDFINSFSHEFKTPIVSIRGFARQLQREDLTEEQKKEYVDIIVRESERLANMSSNILLLTRLENQQIMPDLRKYRLDEQLREAVLLLERQWSEKELELEIDLTDLSITANEEMLSHVWINLIGNAVKFSNPGGKLGVSCRMEGTSAVVKISDSGVGMDEATQKRIFDKFYQGDVSGSASPSHATEGNGLGLPLAKRIVELSGGCIRVESRPGQGSVFTVELPMNNG